MQNEDKILNAKLSTVHMELKNELEDFKQILSEKMIQLKKVFENAETCKTCKR